ncbi:hypothetical protein VS868_11910 [Salinimicrobium sp. 3283s]|uniref:hypothetical protein n=1 Tax=Salinimicrobium sp. 3283s TaxID=3114359 RepID=UPI0031EF1681
MNKYIFVRWCARLLLLAFFLLSCLMCTSCKSVKKSSHKKIEKVSELDQRDIKTSEKIEADVSILRITKNDRVIITPFDNSKPVQVINGKDTLHFSNARVNINSSSSSEQINDKTVTGRSTEEKKTSEKETVTKEKGRNIEKKGTSPALIWGLIAAGLLVGAFFYFRKQLPF